MRQTKFPRISDAGIAIESRKCVEGESVIAGSMAPDFEIFREIQIMRMISFFQADLRLRAH